MGTSQLASADNSSTHIASRASAGSLEEQAAASPGGPLQMSAARRVAVFAALSLSMLLASLDLTIVTTAIPKISAEFDALSDATWIATAYMLTTTVLQPLYGRLSDTFGRTPTLVAAILLFMSGSAACGWAPSLGVLIFGRALQGVGGAGLLALVFIVVSDLTSEDERPAYMGVLGAVWSVASVIGPLLGGVFSDKATWRWAFWVNLPIAGTVLAIIAVLMRLPTPAGSLWHKLRRIDFVGSAVLVGAVVMLLLALTWGGKTFPWRSARIICLLVFSILALALFVGVEWRLALEPTVPMHLLRIRNVCLAVANQFFIGMVMYSTMYFVPIWYTIVKNASATAAGLHLLPFLLGVSLVALVAGFLVTWTGCYRPFVITGTGMLVVGAGLLILLDEHSGHGKQIGFLVLMGAGLGLNIQIMLVAAQTAAPPGDMAAVTTLYLFMRVLGSSIGVAVLESVLQNAVIPKLDALAAEFPTYAQVFHAALDNQSAIYTSGLPADIQARLVHDYVLALRTVFIATVPLAAAAFLLTLPLQHIPLRTRPKSAADN
ncbi:hypothetical protein H4R19_001155 [Coemansia spiralis]|nr:hypothetical protein H4R19_001155 [Coemansia spiralis]